MSRRYEDSCSEYKDHDKITRDLSDASGYYCRALALADPDDEDDMLEMAAHNYYFAASGMYDSHQATIVRESTQDYIAEKEKGLPRWSIIDNHMGEAPELSIEGDNVVIHRAEATVTVPSQGTKAPNWSEFFAGVFSDMLKEVQEEKISYVETTGSCFVDNFVGQAVEVLDIREVKNEVVACVSPFEEAPKEVAQFWEKEEDHLYMALGIHGVVGKQETLNCYLIRHVMAHKKYIDTLIGKLRQLDISWSTIESYIDSGIAYTAEGDRTRYLSPYEMAARLYGDNIVPCYAFWFPFRITGHRYAAISPLGYFPSWIVRTEQSLFKDVGSVESLIVMHGSQHFLKAADVGNIFELTRCSRYAIYVPFDWVDTVAKCATRQRSFVNAFPFGYSMWCVFVERARCGRPGDQYVDTTDGWNRKFRYLQGIEKGFARSWHKSRMCLRSGINQRSAYEAVKYATRK